MRSLQSEIARHEVSYALLTTATAYIEDPNAALRVELENKDQQQIAVLGRSFEFRISQRRVETDSGWDPETVWFYTGQWLRLGEYPDHFISENQNEKELHFVSIL